MEKALFEQLNAVYAPLRARASELTGLLVQAGFDARWGWYGDHSVRIEGEYRTQEFPIPVVDVADLCDVGFGLDGCWLELHLSRAQALAFDWKQLPEDAEVYGAEDFLSDFYHAGMDMDGIARRIAESGEKHIHAALSFPRDADSGELLAAAERCQVWKRRAGPSLNGGGPHDL